MKITPVLSCSNSRVARNRAVALLAMCLGAAALSAQSSSSSNSTGTPQSSNPSNSGTGSYTGANSPSGSNGSSSTSSSDRSTSSNAGSSMSSSDTSGSGRSNSGSELKRADRRFLTKAAEGSMKEVALSELAQERASNPQVKSFAQQMVSDHTQMNNDLMQLAQRKGVSLDEGSRFGWLSGHGSRHNGSADATGSTAGTTGAGMSGTAGTSTGTGTSGTSGSTGVASSTSGTSASGMNSATDSDLTNDRHYRSLAKKTGADFDKEYVDMMVDDHETDVKLFEKAAKDAKDPEVRSFASSHLPTLQAHLQHIQSLNKSVAE